MCECVFWTISQGELLVGPWELLFFAAQLNWNLISGLDSQPLVKGGVAKSDQHTDTHTHGWATLMLISFLLMLRICGQTLAIPGISMMLAVLPLLLQSKIHKNTENTDT